MKTLELTTENSQQIFENTNRLVKAAYDQYMNLFHSQLSAVGKRFIRFAFLKNPIYLNVAGKMPIMAIVGNTPDTTRLIVTNRNNTPQKLTDFKMEQLELLIRGCFDPARLIPISRIEMKQELLGKRKAPPAIIQSFDNEKAQDYLQTVWWPSFSQKNRHSGPGRSYPEFRKINENTISNTIAIEWIEDLTTRCFKQVELTII